MCTALPLRDGNRSNAAYSARWRSAPITPRRLTDGQRGADRQRAREPDHVRVAQPDAAVGDRAWEQVGPVGPVDADVPAAGPVGEGRGAGARPEGDRAVERAL